jgi:ribose transport system substrate-binding protein
MFKTNITKKVMIAVLTAVFALGGLSGLSFADDKPYLVISIRTLDNEYYHAVGKGLKMFGKAIGVPEDKQIVLLSEGSSEKQVSDLRSVLARTGKNAVFYFDPNESPVAIRLAEICKQAGVYFATEWNKPNNVGPWDYDPYWVTHTTLDGVDSGYKTGKALMEAMGGKGKVAAIQGRLANSIAIARYKGFEKALKEFPGIKLVEARPANWSRQQAMKNVESWLVSTPDLGGVWAANDEMALGAVEALRAMNKAGKVPVTGIDATGDAVGAVLSGEMVATISPDPYWQVGMSLSFAYHAYTGKIKPAELPKEKRAFYIKSLTITPKNAKKFLKEYVNGEPKYDYTALWKDKWLGQVRDAE